MKRIQFLEVGMKNYGPYLEPMVLPFNQDVITMIVGPNGIGKSMALDAICFTLYGLTSKGLKADEVVNNVAKKNCKTWVKFMVNDIAYTITRYQKYTKIGSTVILNRGGVDIKKGHREVLPEIERLICNRKSFLNTLMFGQKVKDFFTDLKDSDKKEIFRTLLDLDKYKIYYDKCSDVIKKIKETIDSTNQQIGISTGILENAKQSILQFEEDEKNFYKKQKQDVLSMESTIQECERMLAKWRTDILKLHKPDLVKTIKEIEILSQQLISLEGDTYNKVNELEMKKGNKVTELNARASDALKEIDVVFGQIKNKSSEQIIQLQNELKEFTEVNTQGRIEAEIQTTAFMSSVVEIDHRVHELEDTSGESKCPTCQQVITEEKVQELQQLIDDYKSKKINIEQRSSDKDDERKQLLRDLKVKADYINEKIEYFRHQVNKSELDVKYQSNKTTERLKEALTKVQIIGDESVKQIRKGNDKKHSELVVVQNALYIRKYKEEEELKEFDFAQTSIDNFEKDLDHNQKILQLKKEEEYDKTQLNLYKNKVHELYISIEQNEEAIKDKVADLEIYEFWKQAFSSSGIPSMLIDESIPFMNKRVDYYLNLLANGRYIVSFDTLGQIKSGEFRDKITVNVFDSQTKANNRLQLSGGQTRIVDIATILTLGDLQSSIQNVSFNLLVFDEIFDSLDDENINYVSRIMTKLKIGKSIYIISHRHVDQLDTDEVLEFK